MYREYAKPRKREVTGKCQQCRQDEHKNIKAEYWREVLDSSIIEDNAESKVCDPDKYYSANVGHYDVPCISLGSTCMTCNSDTVTKRS